MTDFQVQSAPIDSARLGRSLADRGAGAYVAFEGWVREDHDGREVTGLVYEAFAGMVEAEGGRLLGEARVRFAISGAKAVHRIGKLEIGDCAIWVGVTAAHRQEAFLACRWIMDTIKVRLPVWKNESYANGSSEWVHAGSGSASGGDDPATDPHYARQIGLPWIGAAGQRKLADSKVLVVGAGGLGCPALQYLAAAGVGHLTVVDGDTVERSNLHRQILFAVGDIGKNKATTAADKLRQMNPNIVVRAIDDAATVETLPELLEGCDVLVDGTDNFETKYMLHDLAWGAGVPIVQAAVYQVDGWVQVFDPGRPENGCFRCLWPEPPPIGVVCNCAEAGVIGVTPGLLGVLQATEVLKLLLDAPGQLGAETLQVDVLGGQTRRIRRVRREGCACRGIGRWPELPKGLLFPGRSARRLRERARTVDLREASERVLARCGIADLVEAPAAEWDRLREMVDGGPVVLCCAAGLRSRVCLDRLGYPNGWYAWTRSIREWEDLGA